MSAALMTLATFSVSAEIGTMPMLAPTDNVLAPHTKRKSRIAWRTPSAMRVAGRMATGVVDELELIEVDVQQRVRALAALRREQCAVQTIIEFAPVDQTG